MKFFVNIYPLLKERFILPWEIKLSINKTTLSPVNLVFPNTFKFLTWYIPSGKSIVLLPFKITISSLHPIFELSKESIVESISE